MTTPYVQRDMAETVLEALRQMPVVVVTGLRQTGKSTFLQQQPGFSERQYVSLDDFAQLEGARSDPDGFIDTGGPLSIDEAQKCPELLTAIKKAVDKKRMPGRFLLSGSANFAVLRGITESLAGRAVYFVMHPLSRRELSGKTSHRPLLRGFFTEQKILRSSESHPVTLADILEGGMPPVVLGEVTNPSMWFKGYEQTYLERDVRDLSQIANIMAFRHLLRLTALRTGQLLSPSEVGRDAKLSVATASRYLSLLEASFVIYRLHPYLRNRASRLIKSPKLYVSDSGLACYLSGLKEPDPHDPLMGAMFETYVAQNLSSVIDSTWPEASLHFWNVQGRHEVDFVVEVANKCIAIEVKSSARWAAGDLSGLRAFLAATPHCVGGILAYNGRDSVSLGERLWAIPLDLVLS